MACAPKPQRGENPPLTTFLQKKSLSLRCLQYMAVAYIQGGLSKWLKSRLISASSAEFLCFLLNSSAWLPLSSVHVNVPLPQGHLCSVELQGQTVQEGGNAQREGGLMLWNQTLLGCLGHTTEHLRTAFCRTVGPYT